MKTLYRKSASLDSPVLLVIKDMDNQVKLVPLTQNMGVVLEMGLHVAPTV